mmetsp:Transcript_38186/g.38872  ORF Transcript_38186/g.38872 Transcript_38186/m.38872 type:complete len:419 (+) Transcript_38186:157-1413(+)
MGARAISPLPKSVEQSSSPLITSRQSSLEIGKNSTKLDGSAGSALSSICPGGFKNKVKPVSENPTQEVSVPSGGGVFNKILTRVPSTKSKKCSVVLPDVSATEVEDIDHIEEFLDSSYIRQWLAPGEARDLLEHLLILGKDRIDSLKNENPEKDYKFLSLQFGEGRPLDKARALDRQGIDYESWLKIQEPTSKLALYAQRIRKRFNLDDNSLNSMIVNIFYSGESMCTPAHHMSVTSLQEDSSHIFLSLGSTRDLILCDNNDDGKILANDFTIKREWTIGNGDLFILGSNTNQQYCHAIQKDLNIKEIRIEILFRTINKNFIDINGKTKLAHYSNGNMHDIRGEVISTLHIDDIGNRELIGDLIERREEELISQRLRNNKVNGTVRRKTSRDELVISRNSRSESLVNHTASILENIHE